MRRTDIWEAGQARDIVLIHSIAKRVVRGVVWQPKQARTSRRWPAQDIAVAAGDRTDGDIGHVVFEAPAVGEASQVAGQGAQPVASANALWRNGDIQPQLFGCNLT